MTGTVSGRQGNETEIKDGKLDKDVEHVQAQLAGAGLRAFLDERQ